MPNACFFTGKKTSFGNQITRRGRAKYLGGVGTKVTGITSRRFKPNLHKVRALVDGKVVRIKVSAKAIKSGFVVKPVKRRFTIPGEESDTPFRPHADVAHGCAPSSTAGSYQLHGHAPRVLIDISDSSPTEAEQVRFLPPPLVGTEIDSPAGWADWLTFRKFANILHARVERSGSAGGNLSRAQHAFSSLLLEVSDGGARAGPNDDRVLNSPTIRDGVVKIEYELPSVDFWSQVPRLRTAYVCIIPGKEQESLRVAAELVVTLKGLFPKSPYPVVIGPITDMTLSLADAAFEKSVRVSTRDYESYIENEGRLRGPASRLR